MSVKSASIPHAFVSTMMQASWSKRIRSVLSLPFVVIGLGGIIIASLIAGEEHNPADD
jgi:prolipoprotein diacylglyceryltransferase